MMRVEKARRYDAMRALLCLVCVTMIQAACGGGDEPPKDDGPQDMGEVMCTPDCEVGEVCVDGMCEVDEDADMGPVSDGTVGAPCDGNGACAESLCLVGEDTPGGYCSKVCNTGLPAADDRCPLGSVCVQVGDGASTCLDSCDASEECREGYVCDITETQGGVCVVKCGSDFDCDLEEACSMDGRCVPDTSGKRRVGSVCRMDADCKGSCFDEAGFDWPGGMCVGDCTGRQDGDFCDGSNAESGFCAVFDDGTSVCLESCQLAADCREGYICSVDDDDVSASGHGFCYPGCKTLGCFDDEVCDFFTEVCLDRDSVSQLTTTTLLGTHRVGNGNRESFAFEVPEDALSIALTLESDNAFNGTAYVTELRGPSNVLLYDISDPFNSPMDHGPYAPTPTSGFIYPNAPELDLNPGSYTVEISAFDAANVTVHLHIKSGSSVMEGRLPMTLWFLDNSYLTVNSAQTDPDFQAALAEMSAIFEAVGIEIGPFAYRSVSPDVAAEYAVIDLEEDPLGIIIGRAFGESPGDGVHLFFNDQLFRGRGDIVLGVSPGLLGAPAINDIASSGVFVALDPHYDNGGLDFETMGATMAHEVGHYFGLFHLSESDGLSHDPLLDTPECASSRDLNRDGEVSSSECGDEMARHVMFWVAAPPELDQTYISPDQRWVLHRNPSIFP